MRGCSSSCVPPKSTLHIRLPAMPKTPLTSRPMTRGSLRTPPDFVQMALPTTPRWHTFLDYPGEDLPGIVVPQQEYQIQGTWAPTPPIRFYEHGCAGVHLMTVLHQDFSTLDNARARIAFPVNRLSCRILVRTPTQRPGQAFLTSRAAVAWSRTVGHRHARS